jgi:3-hydroxyacyl-[acyl-carrier-protein] dehydratase
MNRTEAPLFDRALIIEILPHRSPFLFVDRVLSWTPGKQIVAERDIAEGEPQFAGHFPGHPVMPGVLISEALAQTSGLLLGLTWRQERGPNGSQGPGMLYLASLEMKYLTTVGPGQTLTLESVLSKAFGESYLFLVSASVKGAAVARGKISLARARD